MSTPASAASVETSSAPAGVTCCQRTSPVSLSVHAAVVPVGPAGGRSGAAAVCARAAVWTTMTSAGTTSVRRANRTAMAIPLWTAVEGRAHISPHVMPERKSGPPRAGGPFCHMYRWGRQLRAELVVCAADLAHVWRARGSARLGRARRDQSVAHPLDAGEPDVPLEFPGGNHHPPPVGRHPYLIHRPRNGTDALDAARAPQAIEGDALLRLPHRDHDGAVSEERGVGRAFTEERRPARRLPVRQRDHVPVAIRLGEITRLRFAGALEAKAV